MTQIRSIILLFAFLAGAIQPLIPMLEYHIFKESIIEHLCENRHDPDSDCDGLCYLAKQIHKSHETSDHHNLSSTYYPGAVFYGHPLELIRPVDRPTLLPHHSTSLFEVHLPPAYPPPEFA